jgi:tetratricopeptide (TPR) repeat protein
VSGDTDHPDPQQLRTRADELLELHEAGELEVALESCEELLADLAGLDVSDPVVRETVFTARFERALLLGELGELLLAAEAYRLAAATPADPDDPDQVHELAMAALHQGICLDAVGDHDAALQAYDQLISRFGGADDPVTANQVVRGRVNRAATLLALDRVAESLEAAGRLVEELDPSDALEAEQLAMAVRVRAAALRAADRVPEAAASLADVDRLTDEDPAARSQVALALLDRADALVELDRTRDAVALLDAAVARYSGDPDPVVMAAVDELVAVAADLHERIGDPDGADAVRGMVGD